MSSPESRLWSIRRRLTWRLTVTLAAVLTLLFVAMDYWIDAGAHDHLDSVLESQSRSVAYALTYEDHELIHRLLPHYGSPGHTEFFSVYDAAGRMTLASSNSRGIALAAPLQGTTLPIYYDVMTPDGHRGRALAVALSGVDSGQMLVVATEREAWDNAEGGIHSVLLVGIAVTVVVIVFLVQLMVRDAFRSLLRHGESLAMLDADVPLERVGKDLPTELAPLAAAFNTGIANLYDAVQRERRFSRDIAHELRTPLAETRVSAEVALLEGGSETLRAALKSAIASTERMQRTVDTMLALARFESGQESPALDPLNLTECAREQVKTLHRLAEINRVTVDLHAKAEVWVHTDVGIVERILTNLLQNAVEYAPAGSAVHCSISRTDRSSPADYFFCVDNEAPQLTQGDLAHLGTRFWRKPAEGGTAQHAGLGLALASTLARSLKLQLHFELKGARLHVRLGPFSPL